MRSPLRASFRSSLTVQGYPYRTARGLEQWRHYICYHISVHFAEVLSGRSAGRRDVTTAATKLMRRDLADSVTAKVNACSTKRIIFGHHAGSTKRITFGSCSIQFSYCHRLSRTARYGRQRRSSISVAHCFVDIIFGQWNLTHYTYVYLELELNLISISNRQDFLVYECLNQLRWSPSHSYSSVALDKTVSRQRPIFALNRIQLSLRLLLARNYWQI